MIFINILYIVVLLSIIMAVWNLFMSCAKLVTPHSVRRYPVDTMHRDRRIILASSSPRRKALMEEAGLSFEVVPSDVDESIREGEVPLEHTKRLACEKARKVGEHVSDGLVIGADTVVVVDGTILGKPVDTEDARRMLRCISGRTHTVVTAFCILDVRTGREVVKACETRVRIKSLSEDEIEDYLRTGESLDKAGAYAVQGVGRRIVEKIDGSYTNVVGLPMDELKRALEEIS